MPLNKKGLKIREAMQKFYGKKKGEAVFYASENKGNIKGVTKHKPMKSHGAEETGEKAQDKEAGESIKKK
jgi:hypothetical protein